MADDLPLILYDNALAEVTSITASSEHADALHPVENVADWKPFTSWKPDAGGGGSHTIEAIWGAARTVSAWALFGHNLKTLTGSVLCQYWVDGAYATFTADYTALSDNTIYKRGAAAVSTTKIKWTFTAAATLELSVLCVGNELAPAVGCQPGWTTPDLGQIKKTLPIVSRDGQWLGVSVEQEAAELTLQLQNITEAWATASWLPFKLACQTRPFFLLWYSAGTACFCTGAEFDPCAFTQAGFQSASVTFRAEL